MDMFGYSAGVDDRIDSSDGERSTLAHDKEIVFSKGSAKSSDLRDRSEEEGELHL